MIKLFVSYVGTSTSSIPFFGWSQINLEHEPYDGSDIIRMSDRIKIKLKEEGKEVLLNNIVIVNWKVFQNGPVEPETNS